MPVSDSGTVSQEIVQTIDPTKVKLTGVADITYPVGWTLSYCSGAATDCTIAANFSATTPANATAWAAVKAVKAAGSIVSEGASGTGKQVASRTSTGVLAPNGSSVSGASAGDGWDVFFDPGYTRVFNRYHHKSTLRVDCNWLRTENGHTAGANCWSPFTADWGRVDSNGVLDIPFAMNSNRSTGWIDSSNRLWAETVKVSGNDGYGFFCIDVSGASPQPCAGQSFYRLLTPAMSPQDWDEVKDLAVVDGKIFTTSRNYGAAGTTYGKYVLCLDTRASGGPAPCPGQPYALPSGPNETVTFDPDPGAIAAISGKVYALGQSSAAPLHRLWCIDPTKIVAGATSSSIGCTGWAANPVDAVQGGPIITAPNSSGVPVAACTAFNFYGQATCINLADGTTTVPGLPSNLTGQLQSLYLGALDQYGKYSGVATSKTRVYWPYGSKVACFDAATNAMCSGGSWVAGQVSEQSVYAIRIDPMNPRCFWTNSDLGSIKVWTDTGVQGCSVPSPAVTFPAEVSVPRMACTANSGIQEWVDFRIAAAGSVDRKWSSASLSVLDPSGTALSGWSERSIPDSGVLSLAGLPVSGGSGGSAWVAGDLDFRVTFADPTYVTAPSATIKVIGDAPQLCLSPLVLTVCPSGSGPVSGLSSGSVSVSARGSSTDAGNVTTSLSPVSASTTVSAATSAQCGATLSGAATLSGTATGVAGVLVSLLDSSGNAISVNGSPVSATTDASGNYSFGYLFPGSYKVRFADSGLRTVASTTVTGGGSGSTTDNTAATSLVSNTSTLAVGTNGVVNSVYNTVAIASPDTSTGARGDVQTINVKANDTAGTGNNLTSPTLKFCTVDSPPSGCTLTTKTVAGEGVYSLSGSNVVFTPCSAANTPAGASCTGAFTGPATAVAYQITDSGGQTATSTISPTVVPPPSVTPDAQTGAFDTNQTYTPASNDTAATGTTLNATSVRLCPTNASAPFTSSNCSATSVTTADGVYTLDATTGTVTFDPSNTFTGPATAPVRYVVADALGQYASSTITPTVTPPAAAVANPNTTSGVVGAVQSVNLLTNDTTPSGVTFTASSTRLCAPGTTAPNCVSTTVDVPNVGTYSLTNGTVTFTPCTAAVTANCTSGSAFTGTPTALGYQVPDSLGRVVNSTYTPTVVPPPSVTPDAQTGAFDTNQTYAPASNDTAGAGTTLNATSLRLCPTAATAPFTSSNCSATSVTTADGAYTLDATTGTVTFDPSNTFTGPATVPVWYVVADALGQYGASTITPTVTPPGASVATANTTTGIVGASQSANLLTNDTTPSGVTFTASSTRLCVPGTTAPNCVSTTVDVPNVGTYSLTDGTVTFTPCTTAITGNCTIGSAFTGTPAALVYQVSDSLSRIVNSTYTPTVVPPPVASADGSQGVKGQPQTITLLSNDAPGNAVAPFDPATLRLCGSNETAPNCTSTSVTVSGEGTYTLNPSGTVTFSPDSNFVGATTPQRYVVTDTLGQVTSTTFRPNVVLPPAPITTDDTETGPAETLMIIDPLVNDSAGTIPAGQSGTVNLIRSSLRLCDRNELAPNCTATQLTTVDGTYIVDTATGFVTFTPRQGFSGVVTQPVMYQIANDWTGPSGIGIATAVITPIIDPVAPLVVPPTLPNGDSAVGAGGSNSSVRLPNTGTDTCALVLWGVLLVCSGGALVFLKRRAIANR